MNNQAFAETEVKIDITHENISDVEQHIQECGFVYKDSEHLQDLFLTRERSQIKGWDFVRLRLVDNHTCIRTKKTWQMSSDGSKVRLEEETEVPKDDFLREALSRHVVAKDRKNFKGKLGKYDTTLSIDTLTINGQKYLFLEVEILTQIEDSGKVRESIIHWINTELFNRSMPEAMSIMDFLDSLQIDVLKK